MMEKPKRPRPAFAHLPAKVRHVLDAKQTRPHTCHWPGCTRQVKPAFWGCRPHWYALPAYLRAAIWHHYRAGQEDDGKPTAEYLAAARLVQEWIAAQPKEKYKGVAYGR